MVDQAVYLTAEEVADHFRVSARMVRRLVQTGRLRGVYIGRRVRIPADAMREYEQRLEQEAGSRVNGYSVRL